MKKGDVVAGILAYIAHLCELGRYSTAKSYRDALRSFKSFCGMEEIPYAYIDRERLLLYQAWLLKRGCTRNTVSTYMRRIRHIYNLAVEAGEASYIPNLFKGVFTGVENRRKRALPAEEMRRLMRGTVVDPSLRHMRLAVRLMFAFCGMAFVDLAHLRWANIREGVLSYYRQKSGSFIQIEIPSEVFPILEELAACTGKDSPYLFPFLSGAREGEDAYKEYNGALARFNRSLKSLAKAVGLTTPVSSYTIRHSFATTLKERDVPIAVISELLGHKSIRTTQIYLKGFSMERLSVVNRACFESVYLPIHKEAGG
ncbi:tyrosine-type recombinase/integrase [Parabacteroides sp. ZJ-118]|uniref:tyrosine-type recombinase/integrase n=1 Tax=Parabacteroides sp. ZJ-118 TaxID=2709398 RepID=UPI0013EA82BF|nr:tyrosine-type recombinase/integrase [Parabacteroides sp. ZJ-118]